MSTIFTAPRHYILIGTILAMAAIILAVALTATGPAEAQRSRTGDNVKEYAAPVPCSEEAEPDATTAGLIGEGFVPVFEGFWDYEVGHLSNNFCPPEVTIVPDDFGGTTITRTDANINIRQTAFSIPDSYKATVIDSRHSSSNPANPAGPDLPAGTTTIDLAHYDFLGRDNVVSPARKENGETILPENSTIYWVRLDDPTTRDVNETSPLKLGLSTALMKDENWHNAKGAPVQFRFAAVHVLQDGTPVEAHVLDAHFFAFSPRSDGGTVDAPLWSNAQTDTKSVIGMGTEQYRPLQFAFTKPGQYLVQAQVQGHVQHRAPAGDTDWKPLSPDATITSPVQWYTLHVGSEADLRTEVTAGAVSGNTVPITVTAENSGPDGAENVEVEVNLPEGLSAPETLPDGATYTGCCVVAWDIGDLASGAMPSLHFNATVDDGASGKRTITSEIRSTTYDTDTSNNADSAEVTLSGTNVRPPYFPGVTRNIVEHAVAGTHAGTPVAAISPDKRDLTYVLEGPSSNWFDVYSNGQIVLADGHSLNYTEQWEYPLTLHVTDGVNADGRHDSSYDDSIPVLIQVIDTEEGTAHPTINFTSNNENPVAGDSVRVTATVTGLTSEDGNPTACIWYNEAGRKIKEVGGHLCYADLSSQTAGSKTFRVHVYWTNGGMTATTTVTWS